MYYGHQEEIRFNVVPIRRHQIILGILQLKSYNPEIDQILEKIRFTRYQYIKKQDLGEIYATKRSGRQGYNDLGLLLKYVLVVYKRFWELFKEELGYEALPDYSQQDYKIPLDKGKEPPCLLLFKMSEIELRTLKEYIDVNLVKGFIRESSLKARALVLFIPKKNGKLRLYVDYRKLNTITKKDRYVLLLVDKLRDRL